jgi:hypothetical protein
MTIESFKNMRNQLEAITICLDNFSFVIVLLFLGDDNYIELHIFVLSTPT